MDLIYTLLSLLSLFKNRFYCNVENIIYKKDDKNIPDIHSKIKIECKVLDSRGFENYSGRIEMKKNIVKFRYLLNQGCKMYIALHDEEIVGYIFICNLARFKPNLYNLDPLFAGPNKYYIFNVHTFEKYRRNRIFLYLLTRICRDTIQKTETILASVDITNIPSQKGFEKTGFKKLGTLSYIQLGSLKIRQKMRDNI